jgi:hypothetical protein
MIAPGQEYLALLDEIETDLRQLIDPVNGEPAVEQVVRTAGYHIDGPSELIPDLFVRWKSSARRNQAAEIRRSRRAMRMRLPARWGACSATGS